MKTLSKYLFNEIIADLIFLKMEISQWKFCGVTTT